MVNGGHGVAADECVQQVVDADGNVIDETPSPLHWGRR